MPVSMSVASRYTPGGGGVSITDSFDRANSNTTMGNTDTGETWTPNLGTWGITANRAYSVPSTSQATTVIDSGVSDCTIEVTMSVAGDAGLCFRATDNDNVFVMNSSNLFRRQAGGFTNLGAYGSLVNGDVLRVTLSGSSIEVFVNGVSSLSIADSFNLTATSHGLRSNGPGPEFENFSVTA